MERFVVARLACLCERLFEHLDGFLLALQYFFSQNLGGLNLFLVELLELVKQLGPDLQIHCSFHVVG